MGCISVMGYFCRPVVNGSSDLTSGLSVRQYYRMHGEGGRYICYDNTMSGMQEL